MHIGFLIFAYTILYNLNKNNKYYEKNKHELHVLNLSL